MSIVKNKPTLYIRDNMDRVQLSLGPSQYYNSSIEYFLKGKVSILTFSLLKKDNTYETMNASANVSFLYEGDEYWLTFMIVKQDEYTMTVVAYPLGLEFNNEDKEPFKAPRAMTFAEYFNYFAALNQIKIRTNEVSSKKLTLEWTGTETALARLFSLANYFEAELSFPVELNTDGSLKQLWCDVHAAHTDKVQGIGTDRRNKIITQGSNIKTIGKTEDKTKLYSAITATGKDGLTISSLEREVKDSDGNVLYYTKKGNAHIYAPQTAEKYPSLTSSNDKWVVRRLGSTEFASVEALWGYLLGELKKADHPEVTWDIQGYTDARIGDTIRLRDDGYKPSLFLDARVTEQKIEWDAPENSKTTYSNVEVLKGNLSDKTLTMINDLIAQNKSYSLNILTSNGISFVDGKGSTMLSAVVMDGIQDVASNFIVKWYKDGTYLGEGIAISVKAEDINIKAVYRFEIVDGSGNIRGKCEATITNVNNGAKGSDGASMNLFRAWAKTFDGEGITLNPPKPNMLPDTLFKNWRSSSAEMMATKDGDTVTLVKTEVTTSRPVYLLEIKNDDRVEIDKKYITSFDVYVGSDVVNQGDLGSMFYRNPDGLPFEISTVPIPNNIVRDKWVRLIGTADMVTKQGNNTSYFGVALSTNTTGTVKIRRPKFEISDYATDFILNVNEPGYEPPQYKYIGTYTDTNPIQSMDPSKYTWADIGGSDGKDGNDGIGKDGTSSFIHTAYSYSPDGKKWFGTKYPNINLFRDQYVLKNNTIGKHMDTDLNYIIRESWAGIFIPTSKIKDLFEPNTVYSIQYTFELLTRADGTTAFTQNAHGTLLLYNSKTGQSISLGGQVNNVVDAETWSVGTTRTRTVAFTTPADLTDWVILCYTMRSMNGTTLNRLERGRFYDIKVEKGREQTLITTNPSDNEDLALPMYTGTYIDDVKEDSTDPSKYTWVLNRDVSKIHMAWSDKEDHSDIVTKWPNPNIYPIENGLTVISSNNSAAYPIVTEDITENGLLFRRVKRTEVTKSPGVFSIYNGFAIDPNKYSGKRLAISFIARADKEYTGGLMSYAQNPSNVTQPNYDQYFEYTIGTEWRQYSTIWESWPSGYSIARFILSNLNGANAATSYVDYANFKIELLEPDQEPTSFIPYGKAPIFKYLGTYSDNKLKGDIRPDKYNWNIAQGKDGEAGPPKYTWIAYADTINGTGITLTSVGKKYIGFANNKDSSKASLTPSDYTWSELGDQQAITDINNTIVSIPRTYIQTNTPTNAKNGDQWWVMSNNTITAYRVYGNGSWIPQKIDQGVMNITQLNSVLINGATIVGPKITSPYDIKQGVDGLGRLMGTMSLEKGILLNEGMYSHNNVAKNTYEAALSLEYLSMVTYEGGNKSKPIGSMFLSARTLEMIDPVTGFKGVLSAEQLTPKAWVTLPLASDFTVAEDATPQYRKIQNLNGTYSVELRGRAKKKSGTFRKGMGTTVGILPVGNRPTRLAMFPVAFSGGNIGRVQCSLEGELQFQINVDNVTTCMFDGIIMPL